MKLPACGTAAARRVGYLILQAEGAFDISAVFAGILVLTAFALDALNAVVSVVERRLLVCCCASRGGAGPSAKVRNGLDIWKSSQKSAFSFQQSAKPWRLCH